MCSAVRFWTISLVIKHAWGESFITGWNKATLPSSRVSTSQGEKKACFPSNQTCSLWHRNGERGGGGDMQAKRGELCGCMMVHVDLHLTSRWTCQIGFLERWMINFSWKRERDTLLSVFLFKLTNGEETKCSTAEKDDPRWQTLLPKCFPESQHLFLYCPRWWAVRPPKVKHKKLWVKEKWLKARKWRIQLRKHSGEKNTIAC